MLKEEKDDKGKSVVELSDDEDEPRNIYAYLIKNGLVRREARKRGDPLDSMPTRRDFSGRPKAESLDFVKRAKPINKIKELRAIFARNDIPGVQTKDINTRISEYHTR